MAQGALGAAGVRRVGYALEVQGRSVRTAGGAGYIVSPRAQLVLLQKTVSAKSKCGCYKYYAVPALDRQTELVKQYRALHALYADAR